MNCPSCWAPLEVLPWAVEVVCSYCNTILLIQRDSIDVIWKQAPIVPFPTTFSIWKYFYAVEDNSSNDVIDGFKVSWLSDEEVYKSKVDNWLVKVYISWHIRCMNASWFWEKWFWWVVKDRKGIFENKDIMIQEDEGLITVFNVNSDLKIDDLKFKNLYQKVGSVVDGYFVVESWICKIEGIEWQFNYPIYGDKIEYIDLKKWADHYLVEKTNTNVLVFKSK